MYKNMEVYNLLLILLCLASCYVAPRITELRYRHGVGNQYMQIGSNAVSYTEGSSLELRVDVDSSPHAYVVLLRNQTTLAVGVPVSTGIYDINLNNLQCNHTDRYDVRATRFVTRNRSPANASIMQFGLQVSCTPRRYNSTNNIIKVTGEMGQLVVLKVTVIANPKPMTIWSDGVSALVILQNSDCTYTIRGLIRITTQSDFQMYYLNITNTLPNVLTVRFQVGPAVAPRITELRYRDGVDNQYMHIGSNAVRYTEGSSLELRVDVDSSPLADVTLLRNQTTLADGVFVSTGKYDINLDNLQCNHTGRYDVRAANFVTRNKSPANASIMQFGLQVSCAPRRYNSTNNIIKVTGEKGQLVVLNVTVIANPMPMAQWSDEVRGLGVVQNNANMYTITGLVRITTQSDFQMYYLNVTNTLPEVLTVLFQINSEVTPRITELRYLDGVGNQYMQIGSNEVRYTEGSSLELRVDVVSSPLADVTLLRNQTTLAVGIPVSTGKYDINLDNLQCKHTGRYDVRAANFVTRNKSTANASRMQFGLQVSCAPRRYNSSNNIIKVTGEKGQFVLLKVTVIANPKPLTLWSDGVRALDVVQNNTNMYTARGLFRIPKKGITHKCNLFVTNTLPNVLTVNFEINSEDDNLIIVLAVCFPVAFGMVIFGLVVVLNSKRESQRQQEQEHEYATIDDDMQSHHELQTQNGNECIEINRPKDQSDANLNQNTQGNITSLERQNRVTTHGQRNNGDEDGNGYIEINRHRGKTDAKLGQNIQGDTTNPELQSIATIHGRRNNGDDDDSEYIKIIPHRGGATQNDDNNKQTYLEPTGDETTRTNSSAMT
ncbi:uncharacterized protein LOC110446381 isoform X2 [Mizuhopecten yessoensis]|uniref:uncharacterized protein LOC110446381 isoform X2 n=1 Tax=Mizuhopecten yessoensis TaxID=6573 RepID=UPI000B45DF32|nr:uncharacterized protein LOC110446381 isoform X2 [Mizuhopecten yessoensis]